MKKVCILLIMTLCISGTSLDNKAESITKLEPVEDSIHVDTVLERTKTLDSVITELKKHDNEKQR